MVLAFPSLTFLPDMTLIARQYTSITHQMAHLHIMIIGTAETLLVRH